MVKFILFDLDDTILDFHKAEHIALSKTLETFGLAPTEAVLSRYSEINQWHWQQLELGLYTRDRVLVGRYEQLFAEFGIDAPAADVAKTYEHNLGIGHYFLPGAQEMLDTLYGKVRMYIVSNGTASVQHSRMESADLKKYFDGIFISQEIGFDKPAKEFFDRALSTIPDFRPEEAVLIGDSLTSDIRGGKNAGIRTVWFNGRHKKNTTLEGPAPIVPDYEVDCAKGVLALLKTL